jgi:hypothetical protein
MKMEAEEKIPVGEKDDAMDKCEKDLKKYKKRQKVYITIIIILLIIIWILLWRWHCPVQGTITSTDTKWEQRQCGIATYDSGWFGFKYSDCFYKKRDEEDVKHMTKRLLFLTEDRIKKRIVVTQGKEGVSKIGEIPSVIIRREKGSGYAESPITIDGRQGLKFERYDTDEKEITLFFFQNGISTIISLYAYYEQPLRADDKLMEESFHWNGQI